MIRAGQIEEADWDSGEWVFVDVGFAKSTNRSCGLLLEDSCSELTFANAKAVIIDRIKAKDIRPLNLLLEAPLSVTFDSRGNPIGRKIERRGSQTRYWYSSLGTSVLTGATYLLRSVLDAQPCREVRLFEGFASFKNGDEQSSHSNDVLNLRCALRRCPEIDGCIVPPEDLVECDQLIQSAFAVAGMNFGVPPVVMLGDSNVICSKHSFKR